MKIRRIALLMLVFPVTNIANAAEIYNQDGNKLDLYGKIDVRNHIGKKVKVAEMIQEFGLELKAAPKFPITLLDLVNLNGKQWLIKQRITISIKID